MHIGRLSGGGPLVLFNPTPEVCIDPQKKIVKISQKYIAKPPPPPPPLVSPQIMQPDYWVNWSPTFLFYKNETISLL